MQKFDAVIIGSGPGGAKAAKVLAENGKKVALISNQLGGECLNYGCIPAKNYLHIADIFEKITSAQILGISATDPHLDWEAMKKRKTEIVTKLAKNLKWSLEKSGITLIEGKGILTGKNSVKVNEEIFESEYIIIATGSAPVFPATLQQSENIISNREIIDLPAVPKTLLIVGGGVIGVEFASIFSTLGSKIEIVEKGSRLLPYADGEVSTEIKRIFERKGIKVSLNTEATTQTASGFEKTLVAVGRRPATENLGLDTVGVIFDKSGITTNDFMQTNVPHIFAVGDIAGKMMLANSAEFEGKLAAEKILGKNPEPLNYSAIPNTVYCLPEIASVGITEEQAKEQNIDYVTSKALSAEIAKALIVGNRDGFTKIIAEKKSRKLIGVHMIGEKSSELIAEASLALSANMTIEEFKKNIHNHPILGESIQEALQKI